MVSADIQGCRGHLYVLIHQLVWIWTGSGYRLDPYGYGDLGIRVFKLGSKEVHIGREKEKGGKLSADSHVFEDRELEKHITPQTLKPKLKQNPLFSHINIIDIEDNKSKPSWTIQDYDRHSAHGQLADYMKVLLHHRRSAAKAQKSRIRKVL
ncbi:uncharacterized protein LOC131548191 isoform X2 [Onychostoma macrolepis]|uniref:uncharacterized protein LOC131548191 isoform X2 n=1 Tax=Onychostoma macrolepis TaxID=369639 RepID=UPI002729BFF8|nr:uncharacterized protein LOC131548191 isoform X2 [Onychostoma macrolepis]